MQEKKNQQLTQKHLMLEDKKMVVKLIWITNSMKLEMIEKSQK